KNKIRVRHAIRVTMTGRRDAMSMPIDPYAGAPGKARLPAALLTATILVIVLTIVRADLLVMSVVRNARAFANPVLLVQAVVIPAILVLLSAVMVILVFVRTPAARVFGIVVCIVQLAWQVLGVVTFTYTWLALTNARALPFPWMFVVLAASGFVVFTFQLICL